MKPMNLISAEAASENVKVNYELVAKKLGRVPNMYQVMANSPAVLSAYLKLQATLAEGSLSKQMAERIALATAEKNGCTYCLSAHDFLGRKAGLTTDDIQDARTFESADAKAHEALTFVQKMLEAPRQLGQDDLMTLREAGYSDSEVLEIIGNVIRNIFTNYVNLVAGTAVDWPIIVTPQNIEAQ